MTRTGKWLTWLCSKVTIVYSTKDTAPFVDFNSIWLSQIAKALFLALAELAWLEDCDFFFFFHWKLIWIVYFDGWYEQKESMWNAELMYIY